VTENGAAMRLWGICRGQWLCVVIDASRCCATLSRRRQAKDRVAAGALAAWYTPGIDGVTIENRLASLRAARASPLVAEGANRIL
jgi:hypothetical protein